MILWPYHGENNQKFYVNSDNTISPSCKESLVLGAVVKKENLEAILTERNSDTFILQNIKELED